jgi:hypothetical protein
MPVLRIQPQTSSSGRSSTLLTQERTGFKPVIPPTSENLSRSSSINHYSAPEVLHFVS